MRLGYACINLSMGGKFTTCRLNTLQQDGVPLLRRLVWNNFNRTRAIIKWNIERGVPLYRLSSELVPFGSHPAIEGWEWWQEPDFVSISEEVKQLVKQNNLRITIHPGQFNNLGSPSSKVIEATFRDLVYQTRLLEFFGGTDLILHVGGMYEGKFATIRRFRDRFLELPENTKKYFRLENDDKIYTIFDVMTICVDLKIKPMYDYHHDICRPSIHQWETRDNLEPLWEGTRVKTHLSSGRDGRLDRAHADFISEQTWSEFKFFFGDIDMDVMIEAKAKDLAVLQLMSKGM